MARSAERNLRNTKIGLVLARLFALLMASMFALYSYSWFATAQFLIASLIAVSALLLLMIAALPNQALDALIGRLRR